jgi:hypothetical protein
MERSKSYKYTFMLLILFGDTPNNVIWEELKLLKRNNVSEASW